jgi:hypothetical protein
VATVIKVMAVLGMCLALVGHPWQHVLPDWVTYAMIVWWKL